MDSKLQWPRKVNFLDIFWANFSPFQSIPGTFWYITVVLVRIPFYTKQFPATELGRWVTSIASVVGVLVLAFPIAILGSTFRDVWLEHDKTQKAKKAEKKEKKKRKKEAKKRQSLSNSSN